MGCGLFFGWVCCGPECRRIRQRDWTDMTHDPPSIASVCNLPRYLARLMDVAVAVAEMHSLLPYLSSSLTHSGWTDGATCRRGIAAASDLPITRATIHRTKYINRKVCTIGVVINHGSRARKFWRRKSVSRVLLFNTTSILLSV